MTELSDQEIEEAAHEAGISPHELRLALAKERHDPSSLSTQGHQGLMRPSSRGESFAHVETRLQQNPESAIVALRHALEHHSGSQGHMQSELEADIYDEVRRIVYRMRAESAGEAGQHRGALIRVDIDPTPAKARQLFLILAMTASVALVGLGSLLVSTASTALFASVLLATLGSVGIFWAIAGRRRGCADALAIANRAVIAVEQQDEPLLAMEKSRKVES